MSEEREIKQLREFLAAVDMSPEERRRWEILLDRAALGDKEALTQARQLVRERDYTPVPGKVTPFPPGRRMCCPKDSAHYQVFEREFGEELTCPEHGLPLIPFTEKE